MIAIVLVILSLVILGVFIFFKLRGKSEETSPTPVSAPTPVSTPTPVKPQSDDVTQLSRSISNKMSNI